MRHGKRTVASDGPEWRIANAQFVMRIDVCASFEQQSNDMQVLLPGGIVKRSKGKVIENVRIATLSKERFHRRNVSTLGCPLEIIASVFHSCV